MVMKSVLLSIIIAFVFIGCSKPSAEEMYNKGVDAEKTEQYDSAIDTYRELIKTYPDSSRTPEAYYAVGKILLYNKRSFNEAIQTFRQLISKFPNHATSPNALFRIGYTYHNELKNIDSARIVYEEFIRSYPSDVLVESAKFELENLGKDPDQILKEQMQLAQKETKQAKKGKSK
jgi:tol-pal system protein YbgF